MSSDSKSGATQVVRRPSLSAEDAGDSTKRISQMIENGEEPKRIFNAICECAANTPGVLSSAIFLPSEKPSGVREQVASFGEVNIANNSEDSSERSLDVWRFKLPGLTVPSSGKISISI